MTDDAGNPIKRNWPEPDIGPMAVRYDGSGTDREAGFNPFAVRPAIWVGLTGN